MGNGRSFSRGKRNSPGKSRRRAAKIQRFMWEVERNTTSMVANFTTAVKAHDPDVTNSGTEQSTISDPT